MTKRETQITVTIRCLDPHIVLEVLNGPLKEIQHRTVDIPNSYVDIEIISYEVQIEEAEAEK